MAIINEEALKDRGGELDAAGLNGIKLILVDHLDTTVSPPLAHLQVHFYNSLSLAGMVTDFDPNTEAGRKIFTISGGHRVPAGWDAGQVHVSTALVNGADDTVVDLTVTPIGDYSTYTLTVDYKAGDELKIDPVFSKIDFKFRPGCFNIDCAPTWETYPAPKEEPVIDYLAKDYDSFKHTMIAAMMERVPGWQATSEADLDQVLIDLFSAAADELSDFQDRVMNEAYLGTARKRVSLARHARLMDYHIHQGNQASTWLALELHTDQQLNLPGDFQVWTGISPGDSSSVVFLRRQNNYLLFGIESGFQTDLGAGNFSISLRSQFENNNIVPSLSISITTKQVNKEWRISDNDNKKVYFARNESGIINIYGSHLHYLINRMGLYTWSDSIPALKAGSVTADLKIGDGSEADTKIVESLIRDGIVTHLLIQEELNPATGKTGGVNPGKRQVLELLADEDNVKALEDPLTNLWYLRIAWKERDKLKHNYCFTVDCHDGKEENISFFNGNLVRVYHGKRQTIVFKDPEEPLAANEFHYERSEEEKWGTICRLPEEYGPLAYKNTPRGGDTPPESTLELEVAVDGSSDPWDEVISLVHSGTTGERGDHFVVETDEEGRSLIRFGNGINGGKLPGKAVVKCTYQVGSGLDGNIGADKLNNYNEGLFPEIDRTWNPFDVTNGRAPEPAAEIIRRVPEAFRARQLRAVTLKDYEDRAEELADVSQAAARYAWTGSWRTVQVAIDPVGTTELSDELEEKVACHLEAVRLIGEDIEIRPPRRVPLTIEVFLCVHPHYWPGDIKFILEQEFSEGYLPDGRSAFFHPDNWTFGQSLHTSQIFGRVQIVQGVDHVKNITMKRFNEPGTPSREVIHVKANEIIRVRNNPDHMEEGSITFFVEGGRR